MVPVDATGVRGMEEIRVKQLSLRALELNGVNPDLNLWIF